MSLEHSPARQGAAQAAYTVKEFCDAHRMSRNELYKQWTLGIGPRYFLIGVGGNKHRRISIEAAAEYRRQREEAAASLA